MNDLASLIIELEKESWQRGFHQALYDHAERDTFHTAKKYQEVCNQK